MGLTGILLGVGLAAGIFLAFWGIVLFSLTLAAPFAYRANMLGVRGWTHDRFGFLPGVTEDSEYAGAAVLTLVTALAGATVTGLGGFLLLLPGLVR